MKIRSVQQVMTQNPTCCCPGDSIPRVAQIMVQEDCGAVPVVDSEQGRRLIGIITDRDIVCRIVAKNMNPAECTVELAMSNDMISVRPDASIDECVRLMAAEQVRRMPVTDGNGQVIGIVSQADLARAADGAPDLEDELAEVLEEVSEPTMSG
jgi:CBS domain-containing protein